MSLQIVAACTMCGRGYVSIKHEGVFCLANDRGRLFMLPEPVPLAVERREELAALALARQALLSAQEETADA